jgi:RNA polymerase sigma-70 factor (ECF subfamily)
MADYHLLTDQELFRFLKEGEAAAFAEIYNRYWSVLFLHAKRMVNDDEEARDLVQDLFTGFWHKAATLELTVSLSGYLYRSMRNKVLDHFKHQKVRNDYLGSLNEFMLEGEMVTDGLVREKELALIIEREIAALPAGMRRVFELSRKQHLSYAQIAAELELSEHTVRSQVSNALRILRTKLGVSAVVICYFLRN